MIELVWTVCPSLPKFSLKISAPLPDINSFTSLTCNRLTNSITCNKHKVKCHEFFKKSILWCIIINVLPMRHLCAGYFVRCYFSSVFLARWYSYPHLCLPLRHLYACLLPPVLVRNRSSWRAASVAGAKLYFCAKTFLFFYFCAIVCARPGGGAGHKLLAVFWLGAPETRRGLREPTRYVGSWTVDRWRVR